MYDFNTVDDETKLLYHRQLSTAVKSFGGINFFLQLLEEMRATTPHPLEAKNSEFSFPLGNIKWNKVIFQDKIILLLKIRTQEKEDNNLLPAKDDKQYKKVLNLVRTLKPLIFTVTPINPEDGDGFTLRPFDIIGDTTTLNPLFDAVFFTSIDTVKKILAYKPRAKEED